MKLIYIANARIPTEKAHGKQIMKTCEALSTHHLALELWLPARAQLATLEQQDPFAYYGCTHKFILKFLPVIDLLQVHPGVTTYVLEEASFLFSLLWQKYRGNWVYTRSLTAAVLAKLLGAEKVVFEIHNITENPHTFKIHQFLWKFLDGITAISFGLAKFIENKGFTKVTVVPDAVDLNEYRAISKQTARKNLNLPQNKKLVVYVGSMHERKGVFTLAQAAKQFTNRNIQVIFVGGVFTGGDLQKLQSYVKDKKIGNVIFTGFITPTETPNFLRAADVLVLPDSAKFLERREFTSPMKLFEYLAAAVPIVASANQSVKEVLTDRSNSILVPPDDPKALSAGIILALQNQKLATKISRQAKIDAQKYTWSKRADQILGFFNKLP